MPFYHAGEEDRYQAFAALPLPESAVVIDVRQTDVYDTSLLDYLEIDVADLAMEMRLHEVPRWRHLSECIDFLRLDATPPYAAPHEFSDFALTTRSGKQVPIRGRDDLSQFLGRNYLDSVRNHRIKAIKDSGSDGVEPLSRGDPEQPTVRVFFLTDMQESDSLTRAGTYAEWLKEWETEIHGPRRSSRGEHLHIIAICMNADGDLHQEVLTQAFGQRTNTAIDTVFLLQKYSDDEAYIGGDAQIYQAELILYTLLLHWPELLWKTIEDASDPRRLLLNGAKMLPWPIYTVGTASWEYSGRWTARWLDYGVVAKLLETLQDTHKVEQDEQLLQANIQKWLNYWWQQVQATVPDAMVSEVDELQAVARLQGLLASASLLRGPASSFLQTLAAFRTQVSELYTGTSGRTLQQALESVPYILDQFQWAYKHISEQESDEQDQVNDTYTKLADLYTRIRRFVPSHFQGARGAIPRALHQLSRLTQGIHGIRAVEQNPPNLQAGRQEFEHKVEVAQGQVEGKFKTWRLPLLGQMLRSTVISWVVVIMVGVIVLFGVPWQTLLANAEGVLPAFFLKLSGLQDLIVWGIRVLLVLLLLWGELLYLAARKRSLQQERQKIWKELYQTVQGHLAQVRAVVASRVALALLQRADLYTPGENTSPCEQRLRKLGRNLKRAQERAAQQQTVADKRLRLMLGTKRSRDIEESGLNNRQDILAWNQIEDAFLQSCKELTSDASPLHALSEMLLRRLGTETPNTILKDILSKQGQLAQSNGEEGFQALSTLLVAMLLSAEVASPTVTDILPLLKQYVVLKERYLLEPSVLGSDVLDLQDTVKATMLEQALRHDADESLHLMQDQSAEFVLAAWVGDQRKHNPLLLPIFGSNDVIEHLAEHKLNIAQALDTLRGRSTLFGYPDEIAGDDHYYLLLAPGEASGAFLRSFDLLRAAHVRPEYFPDREKLVYLHIHRIRQLLS